MRRGYSQLLTDFRSLQAEVLAHHERLSRALRQPAQAFLQSGEELLLAECAFGLFPGVGRFLPVAASIEQAVEFARVAVSPRFRGRALPALAPDRVDDFVLQDAGQPGAQVRAPGEIRLADKRREQRLLDGVFGGGRVPQLQAGVAQQVGPQVFDLGTEVRFACGGVWGSGQSG